MNTSPEMTKRKSERKTGQERVRERGWRGGAGRRRGVGRVLAGASPGQLKERTAHTALEAKLG